MNTVVVPWTMWLVIGAAPAGVVLILIPCLAANQYGWRHRLKLHIRHRLLARQNAELERGRRRVAAAARSAELERSP